MSGQDGLGRLLVDWFEREALPAPPAGGLDRVLDATRRRKPLPAWRAGLGSHWIGEAGDARSRVGMRLLPRRGARWSVGLGVLLIGAALAALVGGTLLVGARLIQASPSPAGRLGHLAYGLDGDIYVADWDGSGPVRIADGAAGGRSGCGPAGFWGEGPIWSPDGRYLAFRSGFDQVSCPSGGTIEIHDGQGHPVTSFPASFPGSGWLISWSPDSTRVATWLDSDSGTIGIYGLDGVRRSVLTLPPGYGVSGDYDPAWSPDGGSLLIPLRPDPGGDPRRIWELPLDGAAPHPVPTDDPRSVAATYSPDGARVAYVADGGLLIAAADGSQPRVLVPALAGGCEGCLPRGWIIPPVWSPTADRIAFAVDSDGGMTLRGPTTEIRLVDVASGAVTSLAGAGGTDTLGLIDFSSDGERILFARYTDEASSLWSVATDGTDARLLVAGTDWGDQQPLMGGLDG